jgi:dolichyl-phosphate-mannose-protein mannosyltransferase
MSFFSKFMELQHKMIIHNNKLTASHPYQSEPLSWPLLLRGISYWTHLADKYQIYMTGNVAGWWGGLVCILLFCSITVLDTGLRKRGIPFMTSSK